MLWQTLFLWLRKWKRPFWFSVMCGSFTSRGKYSRKQIQPDVLGMRVVEPEDSEALRLGWKWEDCGFSPPKRWRHKVCQPWRMRARACDLAPGTRIRQSYPPAQKIRGYRHEHAVSTVFLQNPSPAPWFPRPSFLAATESFLLNFRAKTFTAKGTDFWNQGYVCSFCIGKQNTPLPHMQIRQHQWKNTTNQGSFT